jgi:hypothetical protein
MIFYSMHRNGEFRRSRCNPLSVMLTTVIRASQKTPRGKRQICSLKQILACHKKEAIKVYLRQSLSVSLPVAFVRIAMPY